MRLFSVPTLVLSLVAAAAAFAQGGGRQGREPTPAQADVREFGAVGDGKADDTEAVRKAVAAGRGVVRFGKGTYRITQTVVMELEKTGFTALEGHGVGQVVMAGEGPAFRFLGTHLTGSADPEQFQPNVWRNQRMPVVDGLEIVGAHPRADGIQVEGTMQFTITRSRFSQLRHGIHLTKRNRNLLVDACHIYHNRGIGIFYDDVSLHQSNIVGTHVSYCGGGGIVLRGGDVRNVHVSGCDLESNHDPNGPPTANVLIDNSPTFNGTAEVAVTGCTIQHNSKSPESANIRILGRGMPAPAGNPNAGAVPQWGHVTISANVFSDVKTNIHLRGCRDVALTGNTFWMGYTHNLLVEECSDIVVSGNVMDRNPAYAYGNTASASNAVVFRNSRDCILTGNQIKGVRDAEAGLLLEGCERFNVTGCNVLDNDGGGILARNLTNSRLSGCIVRDDRGQGGKSPGIRMEGGRGNLVTDNLTDR